ncbi:glycosyltransferase [Desulfosarcina sp. OttesenSCG-928-A07]|nr:glycosyltransferase [Desulfosarcina sp. OttesenSCG-928-G17]MDL2329831.1 glycosyltransferase [Desulfosarcina sp. OttesenSCG-928-A07]
MLASLIRTFSSTFYTYPQTKETDSPSGEFSHLKMALVVDHFTEACLSMECRIKNITPWNYKEIIDSWKPDILFVESTFHGAGGSWRYRLAKQPLWLRLTKPKTIHKVVAYARSRGIPTVFWNKDDGIFFDTFVDVAKSFDHVFTTDANCIPRYRDHVPATTSVHVLMMAYQPAFHFFDGFHFEKADACFTGSYYRRILTGRRRYLDMIFENVRGTGMRINIFDRNHNRFSRHFEFRFPRMSGLTVHPGVDYQDTAKLYKQHGLSLNVNSVVDSETMCSRRLLEILACGGIAVTNPSLCVSKYFGAFCHVVATDEEAKELFVRAAKSGPSKEDKERAAAGAAYVRSTHTWHHRLKTICDIAGV